MALVKDGRVVEDAYTTVSAGEVPPAGAIIVSLEQWQANPDALLARRERLGIRLRAAAARALRVPG